MASWKCGASRDLPLDMADAWDGAAAKAAIFAWAGFDGDSPDSSKARKGFLFYDADAPDKKGSYKDPFATVKDGSLSAVAGGIRAAASRLPQTDGPSSEVKAEARSVLDAYEKKMESASAKGMAMAVYSFPGAVRQVEPILDDDEVVLDRAAWVEARNAELLAMAKRVAPRPSIFDESPPYFWRAEISSGRLDSYWTRMGKTTLQNFAANAVEGRSFLLSHNHRDVTWGYSLDGAYHAGQKTGMARTDATFYTIPGLDGPGGMTSDGMIRRMDSGILRDVSVGFSGGEWICSIDGQDMLTASWEECPHWPGMAYDIPTKDKDGKKVGTTRVVCEAMIENAGLNEVSGVFDGATPGASILRAQRAAAEGRLSRNQLLALERHYRIRLPGSGFASYPGMSMPSTSRMPDPESGQPSRGAAGADDTREVPVTKDGRQADDPEGQVLELVSGQPVIERSILCAALKSAGFPVPDDEADPLESVRAMKAEIDRLAPGAKAHEGCRQRAIDAAYVSGVRALGDKLDKARWGTIFAALEIDEIREQGEEWESRAKDALGGGGRKTSDLPETAGRTNGAADERPLHLSRA